MMSTRTVSMRTGSWKRAVLRAVSFAGFCLFALAPLGLRLDAQVEGYRFVLPQVEGNPGSSVRITVQGEHEESAQGFSFAARFPTADLTIDRVHTEDTILEAMGADFFEVKILADEGILIVASLMDTEPPFEGELIPNVGQALDFFHIEATISETATGALSIQQENGLSTPPVDNLYSVRNRAFFVSELGEGQILLPGSGAGLPGAFLRGDSSHDFVVDISDPIGVLAFAFSGDHEPPCLAAADANDDDQLDISDSILVLEFLFNNGFPLPPPSLEPGLDPTPGVLTCGAAAPLSSAP